MEREHPTNEEWIRFLYRDAAPEQIERLERHRAQCATCRESLTEWESTLERLDRWEVPARSGAAEERQRPGLFGPRAAWIPLRRWLAAAALILFGLAVGRLTQPRPVPIEQVRTAIDRDLGPRLEDAVAASEARLDALWRTELDRRFAALQVSLAAALDRTVTAAAAGSWTPLLERRLKEERDATRVMLRQVEEARLADWIALRKDLETVATVADSEFRRTRDNLLRLASVQRNSGPAAASGEDELR